MSESTSESMMAGFADPARYELWDCKQLEPERKNLARREAELKDLMTKAQSGTAGTVVAEMAYRGDYLTVRGQAHFAEEAWRKNNCHEAAAVPPPVRPAPRSPKPAAAAN